MTTHDTNGRPWAQLSQLRAGDRVEIDNYFPCVKRGNKKTLQKSRDGLFFFCSEGRHYLDEAQTDDGEHLIGIYGPIAPSWRRAAP